jgi:outer membrane protein assembly factor BamB
MTSRTRIVALAGALCALLVAAGGAAAFQSASDWNEPLISRGDLDRLDAQAYWSLGLPLDRGESVQRTAGLDDNLYILTSSNRVFAVHAATGVLRWTRILADADKAIRGPAHNDDYVFFTTGGTVVALNRQTGDAASNPRKLSGVVIEVQHDWATISIGYDHGVRPEDVFEVWRLNEYGAVSGEPIAELTVTSARDRTSRGRLRRLASLMSARPGDRVDASVVLPLAEIKLPFAASCAAVADAKRIYVGAANQRFYSLDIFGGFQHWQLMTPGTVSATPVNAFGQLYVAGQDGRVVCCRKDDRARNWVFHTEGPVFADPLVTAKYVFVASSDRSLYCLDRITGRRQWRVRFDAPPAQPPGEANGRVYQAVPGEGVFALDAADGRELWRTDEPGQFLGQFIDDILVLSGQADPRILRIVAETGRVRDRVSASQVRFATAYPADQSVILAGASGRLLCMRPRSAPRLKPAALAAVLGSPQRAAIAAKVADEAAQDRADRRQEAAAPMRGIDWLLMDDWLSSRSTARPVGGRGLVEVEPPPAEAAKEPDDEEASEEDEYGEDDEANEGEDEWEDDEASDDEESSDDDEATDEDDESDDDESDDDESDDESDTEDDSDDEDDDWDEDE